MKNLKSSPILAVSRCGSVAAYHEYSVKDVKNNRKLRVQRKKLSAYIAIALGLFGISISQTAMADLATCSLSPDGLTYTCTGQYSPYEQSRLNYENVIFNITGGWATSPDIKGVGIYANGGSRIAQNNVTITTNGSGADAIRTNNPTTVVIPGKLIIRANGSSGDGINATVNSAATITIGDDAEIHSNGGVAVRANLSNRNAAGNNITIGENAVITTNGSGENVSSGKGHAIYAGNRTNESESVPVAGSASITLGDGSEIRTAGNNAYAVYANKTGWIQLGSTKITTVGNVAHGIVAQDGIIRDCPSGTMGGIQCVLNPNNYPVIDYTGGQVYLTGDTEIVVDTTKGSYAMYASGEDSLIVSGTQAGSTASGVYTVTGNLVADNEGQIDLRANGASVFNSDVISSDTGSIIGLNLAGTSAITGNHTAQNEGVVNLTYDDYATGNGNMVANSDGTITLNMAGHSAVSGNMTTDSTGIINATIGDHAYYRGTVDDSAGGRITINMNSLTSKWQLLDHSVVTDLNFSSGGGQVILGDGTPANSTNRVDLVIANLTGNGYFHVRADIERDGCTTVNEGDMVHIMDSSSGTHKVYVRDANLGSISAATNGTELLRVVQDHSGGSAVFTLGGDGGTGVEQTYVDVGAYRYILDKEENHLLRANANYWSLGAMRSNPPGGGGTNPPPLTNTAQNAANILNTNYLVSYIENQTLLQRMGQLRQSNGHGGDFWIRAYGGKLSSFDDGRLSGFDMDYHGIQAGIDRRLDVGEGDLYVGVMAGQSKGKADYDVGGGDTESVHVGVYGSYQMDNGFYVDGLIKYVRMDNSFNTLTGGGIPVHGSGDTDGLSIGIEAGKRFYLQHADQGLYLEPQAQLTYSRQGSATIQASNGLRADLHSYDSTIGRASVIVGYSVMQGENPVDVYFKTGYVREFDGKTAYTFNHTDTERYDFGGGWWENGIGVNIQINDRHNLYLDATYSKGGSFDQKQVNVGYRFSW